MLGLVSLALLLAAGSASDVGSASPVADAALPLKLADVPESALAQPPATLPGEAVELLGAAMNTGLPPSERARAIARLASLRDERLLPILGYLMLDRTPEVRRAATEGLGAQRTPGAQETLLAAVRNDLLSAEVRVLGVAQLALLDLPTVSERLLDISKDSSLPDSLRAAATAELRTRFPSLLPPAPASTASEGRGLSGRTLLTLSGIVYGGYSLYGIGRLGKNPDAPTLGLIGGAVLGGVGGYLLGSDLSRSHALSVMTATGLGLWTGLGIGYAAGMAPDNPRLYLLSIGGELLALTTTELLWSRMKPALDPPPEARAGGALPAAVGGSLLGGVGLHLVSQIPAQGGPEFLGAASGILFGATTSLLLGQRLAPPQGALMSTGAFWGLVAGGFAGAAALPLDVDERAVEGAALLGGALGMAAAGLAWTPALNAGDVGLVNLGALTGLGLSAGLTLLPEPRDDARLAYALMAAGTTLGAVGTGLIAPSMQMGAGDRMLVALGATHGLFAGLAVPGLFEREPLGRHKGAGALLGASLGTVAAAAASQFTERGDRQVAALFLADTLASLGGLGLGVLVSPEDPGSPAGNAGFLAGGAFALGLAPLVAPPLELTGADPWFVASGALWGGLQGLALSVGLDGNDRQLNGGWLLGAGAGGLAALALSRTVELSTGQVLAIDAGGVWGLWLSGVGLSLARAEGRENALVLLAASDAGLALSTLLVSKGVTARQMGIANLGGLAGGVALPLFTGLATQDGRSLTWAALIGSVGGLAGGAVAAALLDEPPPRPKRSAAAHGRGPVFTFQGLTTQPVLGRDGRFDGFAIAALVRQE